MLTYKDVSLIFIYGDDSKQTSDEMCYYKTYVPES